MHYSTTQPLGTDRVLQSSGAVRPYWGSKPLGHSVSVRICNGALLEYIRLEWLHSPFLSSQTKIQRDFHHQFRISLQTRLYTLVDINNNQNGQLKQSSWKRARSSAKRLRRRLLGSQAWSRAKGMLCATPVWFGIHLLTHTSVLPLDEACLPVSKTQSTTMLRVAGHDASLRILSLGFWAHCGVGMYFTRGYWIV